MPLASLTPEARLILLTAGGPQNDGAIRRLLEAGEIDWPRLLDVAESEKASLPLWQRVQRLGAQSSVPADIAAAMQRRAMVTEFRMRMLEQRLGEVLEVLQHAKIDALLFKGAALAPMVYGDFVLRPMGDLDLLIDPAQAEEARRLLLASGWRWTHDPKLDSFYEGHHHLPPLVDARGTGTILELHTGLFFKGNPFRFDPEVIRKGARTVRLQRWTVQIPGTLHLLLHTCLHFAWSHVLRKGAWRAFRDVDVLIGSQKIDWPAFVDVAKETRGTTCAYWTFRMARTLSGVEVPHEAMEALRPPVSEFVARRLEQHYAYEVFEAESRCPSEPLRTLMWEAGIQPRWSGHGAIRPWQRDESYEPTLRRPSMAESIASSQSGLRGAAAVARYMLSVAHPRQAAD